MVKTQVQIPDHLYREAKRVANEYEMSFSEVVRRGLERITMEYRPIPEHARWQPPAPEDLDWNPSVTDQDLKILAQEVPERL